MHRSSVVANVRIYDINYNEKRKIKKIMIKDILNLLFKIVTIALFIGLFFILSVFILLCLKDFDITMKYINSIIEFINSLQIHYFRNF